MPAPAKKMTVAMPAHRVEKTAFAVLGVLEKAGKEITQLAREGKKRVVAHERKAVSTTRSPKKTRKA